MNSDAAEVLQFLAQRPIHTVTMMSLIHDNGIVESSSTAARSRLSRLNGQLEGVALVGHATLMETVSIAHSPRAQVARECPNTHMIAARKKESRTSGVIIPKGRRQRLACREWLYELSCPVEAREPVAGLRPARESELEPRDADSGRTCFC